MRRCRLAPMPRSPMRRSTSSSTGRRTAVVSGGTGLYLRAALADLDVPPPPGEGVRERIVAEVERDPAAAHERLAGLDPRAAEAVHANDQRRLVRALELAETGASLVPDDDRLWASATRHPTVIVGLEVPPDELERRIVARTEAMFDAGRRGGGSGRARERRVADGSQDARPRRDRDAVRGRGPRAHRHPHPSLRRLSAEVDAPDPGDRAGRRHQACRARSRKPCSGLPQPWREAAPRASISRRRGRTSTRRGIPGR